MNRGSERDADARSHGIGDACRDRDQAPSGHDKLLARTAVSDGRRDTVAQRKARNARAQAFHNARDFAARREGKLRLRLVFSARNQRVEKVERGRPHAHHDFASARFRLRNLLHGHGIRAVEGLAKGRLHV